LTGSGQGRALARPEHDPFGGRGQHRPAARGGHGDHQRINPANSTETSAQGNNDTSSLDKDIITIVHMTYKLK